MPDWTPPHARPVADLRDIPGAMAGSRLFEQARHREDADRVRAWLAEPGPVVLEIGVDHGMRFLGCARAWPRVRWLGVELRRRRVEALLPHVPANALVWRGDARTLLAALVPPGRLSRIDVLFPDPVWQSARRAGHLLWSEAFVALAVRALGEGFEGRGAPLPSTVPAEREPGPPGCVHLVTDVEAYFRHAAGLMAGWSEAPHPPSGPELSRRERVCRRDGISVWRGTWLRPAAGAAGRGGP